MRNENGLFNLIFFCKGERNGKLHEVIAGIMRKPTIVKREMDMNKILSKKNVEYFQKVVFSSSLLRCFWTSSPDASANVILAK